MGVGPASANSRYSRSIDRLRSTWPKALPELSTSPSVTRADRSIHRRAVLVAGATGLSSLAGCFDRVTQPTDGGNAADGTETPEPRIPSNSQGTGDIPLIRFAAHSNAWVGVGPEGFSEQENPSLTLEEGQEYEILWENRDGNRHQFAIVDADGEELASTEPAETHGRVRSMVITARSEMSRYRCLFHTDAEEGEIEII